MSWLGDWLGSWVDDWLGETTSTPTPGTASTDASVVVQSENQAIFAAQELQAPRVKRETQGFSVTADPDVGVNPR